MPFKFNPITAQLDLVNSTSAGGVTGIPPTNIGAITRWADIGGTIIENSPNTNVQDSGAIEAQSFITKQQVTGPVTVNQDECWVAPSLNITSTGSIDLSGGGSLMILGG